MLHPSEMKSKYHVYKRWVNEIALDASLFCIH